MRLLPKVLATGAIGVCLVLAVQGTATAENECSAGNTTGHDTMVEGPPGSSGYGSWDSNSNQMSSFATPTTMSSGQCLVTYFDWGMPAGGGHYDSRAARSCRSNNQVTKGSTDRAIVAGMQKLGACYGPKDLMGFCTDSPQRKCTVVGNVNPVLPNASSAGASLPQSGTLITWTGGDPQSAST